MAGGGSNRCGMVTIWAVGRMLADQIRRTWIVYDDGARAGRDPLQHGIAKVAFIGRGSRTVPPQLASAVAIPLAIVIDEFVHVFGFRQRAQKQMLQHGVVQDHHARTFDRLLINLAVQLIVADVIEMDVGMSRIRPDVAQFLQRAQQCRRIVRNARTGGRQRRMEADRHAFFLRFPNNAVPTRTQVAPSSMATSMSFDMPMESSRSPCSAAISRNRAK